MDNKKVIIIGAGPAGLSAGYELVKAGYKVDIYEASPYVGGMARSFDLWGQRVDCGPHRFFSKQPQINKFFQELIKDDYTLVNRLTRIYYKNRFFDYPLKIANVLSNLSIIEISGILFYYIKQRLFPIKDPKTFKEWVTNRFGKKLFDIFFKNYSEKLWGIPCSKIDADWAAQRIKSLSLYEAIKNALVGDKNQKHKTLVDQFAYPHYGSGTIYERAADYIRNNGGAIHLETKVKQVHQENEGFNCMFEDGQSKQADLVISTMPLTSLVRNLNNVPESVTRALSKLYFRNTTLIYLNIDALDLFPDNWIYVHSDDVKFGRVTNFRNWCPTMNGNSKTSILCLEYWSFDQDDFWKMDDTELIKLAKAEVRKTSLVDESVEIIDAYVLRVPKCYPVYETGYMEHVNVISDYLKTIKNLIPIGRYGAFKYNNQDHSILMGLLAAEKIKNNESPDELWNINTDTEYQEEGKIKDVLIQ